MSKQSPRILITPTCLKGSLSALDAATVIVDFFLKRIPSAQLDICPLADGGDDTLAVLQQADKGFFQKSETVTGPLPGMVVEAHYLVHSTKKSAVIEAAQAHGYRLLESCGLAPMSTTSYGVGELLQRVISNFPDLEQIVITMGGSTSTDGGFGALQALGIKLFDKTGQELTEPLGGGQLSKIVKIQWPSQWGYSGRILLATDVINPLLGDNGTATVFAPQKGATPAQCRELEQGLRHASQVLSKVCAVNYTDLPGTGAAGGLGYGLRHLPRCGIISGSQWVAEALQLRKRLESADLIITTEGYLDSTSLQGKAIGYLMAEAQGKPLFVFCGQRQEGFPLLEGVQTFSFISEDASQEEALASIANPYAGFQKQLEAAWPKIKALLS